MEAQSRLEVRARAARNDGGARMSLQGTECCEVDDRPLRVCIYSGITHGDGACRVTGRSPDVWP